MDPEFEMENLEMKMFRLCSESGWDEGECNLEDFVLCRGGSCFECKSHHQDPGEEQQFGQPTVSRA